MKNGPLSIRRQLLFWILCPIVGLCLVDAVITYVIAINLATDAYDNTLIESAREVANRLEVEQGKISVDLPPAALEIFKEDDVDKLYYQVLDPSGNLIAGDAFASPVDLQEAEEEPDFVDSTLAGQPVRIAYMKFAVPGHPNRFVILQVAETVRKRQALISDIIIAVVSPQLVLIVLSALAVWFGVSRGLSPLQMVREAIASRSQWDLRPVAETRTAPAEIRPLLDAINDLLGRLDRDMEAQRRFVANAAHQLRTPLAGLKMHTELAQRQSRPEDVLHALKQVHNSADNATRLVNQLLSLAKFEPSGIQLKQFVDVDLNDVARNTTQEMVPYALDREIDLGFEGCAHDVIISANSPAIVELLSNLIDNAIRYCKRGGKVTVRVKIEDSFAVLLVEDNGPGIPEAEKEKVFERFYRVLGNGVNGSGLGLAIVREIALAHNAQVTLGNGVNEIGTVFQVRFDYNQDPHEFEVVPRDLAAGFSLIS